MREAGDKRDQSYMRLALRLARRAEGRTSPNPLVGAVVVCGEEVVGRGYHRRAGADHAEVVALRQAGSRARGAELFVNLEPCEHVGRTGPCTEVVIRAGIRRVVIGMQDPNPCVNGRGIGALRRAGIEVVNGVLAAQSEALNEHFVCSMKHQRPLVTLKSAISLDGRTATSGGDSRWVTGEAARREGHRLRNTHDVIMVGAGTVLADNPQLTCRGLRGGRDPVRVVVDSQLRTPPVAEVVAVASRSCAPTWVCTTGAAPQQRADALERAGAVVLRLPAGSDGRVDPGGLLATLCKRGVLNVLLEGGATLAGAFFSAGLVDRLVALVAPKLLGDPAARPMLYGPPLGSMGEATMLEDVEVRRVGEDLCLGARLNRLGR